MAFDVALLTEFAIEAIADFAREHSDETFYAFAIDESLLCLNSVERFLETLDSYQTGKYGENYTTSQQIANLRANTGDWTYQGFSTFSGLSGYDEELYDDHYNIGLDDPWDPRLKATPYGRAMDAVLDNLVQRDAFFVIRRTLDFKVLRVEHSY